MAKIVEYPIWMFGWSKEKNTFYGDAWLLHTDDHHYAFPSGREAFKIVNPITRDFRKFTFLSETDSYYIFQSEDGILCEICIDPLLVIYGEEE